MLKFSLTLAIILSSLYISFCQAQGTLSACAQNCSQSIGNEVGCNSYQLGLPNCVCLNAQFFPGASGCVWESCTTDEADTAESFWLGVCAAYMSSLSAASTASGYGSSSGTASTSTGYGGHPSSQPISSGSGSATSTGYVFPTTKGPPSGASSVSLSGSGPSSSSTSNLAATMPTHAAALIAGGIGAVVAVFV